MREVEGRDDSVLAWAKYAEIYHEEEHKVLDGKICTALHPSIDKNGRFFIVYSSKLPWKDESGKIIGLVCQAVEIEDLAFLKYFHSLSCMKNGGCSRDCQYQLIPPTERKISPRESECLFLLVKGKTAKEIGRELDISYRTVEVHIRHLRDKFNTKNHAELVIKALQEGYGSYIPRTMLDKLKDD